MDVENVAVATTTAVHNNGEEKMRNKIACLTKTKKEEENFG
jgi:hypothetical protein